MGNRKKLKKLKHKCRYFAAMCSEACRRVDRLQTDVDYLNADTGYNETRVVQLSNDINRLRESHNNLMHYLSKSGQLSAPILNATTVSHDEPEAAEHNLYTDTAVS